MFDIKLLLLQKRSSDPLNIVEKRFSLDMSVQNRMVYFKSVPILLSDGKSCAFCMSLVDEERSSVEAGLISPDHSLARMSNFILDLFIDLVTNIVKAVLDENDFIHIIKLCEYDILSPEADRVKLLQ